MLPSAITALSPRARAGILAGALLAAAALFGFCHIPSQRPLPAALKRQVERHETLTAVDTAEIHRLEGVAARALAAQQTAKARADSLDRAATLEHHRADSLARAAAQSTTAHDSAARFQAAYEARTAEVDTLRRELVAKDEEVSRATQRGDSLFLALRRSESRANRADSVIAAAVKVVRQSDPPCRVAHFFSCPSRTETAVVTAGVALLGDVAYHMLKPSTK